MLISYIPRVQQRGSWLADNAAVYHIRAEENQCRSWWQSVGEPGQREGSIAKFFSSPIFLWSHWEKTGNYTRTYQWSTELQPLFTKSTKVWNTHRGFYSGSFQNKSIFVQLDELDQLGKLVMHTLGSVYSFTKHKRNFSVMVSMSDCCASNLGSIPGQVNFFENFILLNSSN